MSNNFVQDIAEMHAHYQVHAAVEKMSDDKLKTFLTFRIGCLQEELDELKAATTANDAVDAIIDLIVFSIGTLDVYGVDIVEAWNRVLRANMSKEVGIKSTRPNPLGLPDLIKPVDFVSPNHSDNVGTLSKIFG